MIIIYHNPGCKKSREGLKYLQEKTQEIEIKNYLKDGISVPELKDLLMKLNKSPHDMVRTQEADYKTKFKGKNFTDDEWIKIMTENPRLIKRPIIIRNYKAVWGDPVANIDILI